MAVRSHIGAVDLVEPTAVEPYRAGALIGLAAVTAAIIRTLYEITLILGGTTRLIVSLIVALALAWIAADRLKPMVAGGIFAALVLFGYFWYFFSVGGDLSLLIEAPTTVLAHTVSDTIEIATGRSVLTISETGVWALSFLPAPIFLTWYLGFRRRYISAAGFGGAIMLIFVFSGDLSWVWTLVGSIGIASVVGFGAFERRQAAMSHVELFTIVVATMAVTAMVVPIVPGGGLMGPLSLVGDDDPLEGGQSIESTVVGGGDSFEVIGEVDLSPDVRYTIESEEPVYWRTGVYDVYTGSGWESTGEFEPYDGPQRGSESPDASTVIQSVRLESPTDQLPAAMQPVSVEGLDDDLVEVSDLGDIAAAEQLTEGTEYSVASLVTEVPATEPEGEVPDHIADRYTQLPDDMPDRVGELTAELLEGADGTIAKADRIESWLQQEKSYSLDVEQPQGDIADQFIFEMEAGYCTYFATAMVAMLRSADVPARMAVGYANGQQVDDDRWVVRGLNSHAWVEVYLPEHGWVEFDPTPSTPREDARTEAVDEAREDDYPEVDIELSEDLPADYEPETEDNETEATNETDTPDGNTTDAEPGGHGSFDPSQEDDPIVDPGIAHNFDVDLDAFDEPDRIPEEDETVGWTERLGLVLVVLVGLAATVRRTNARQRIVDTYRRRYHFRRSSPASDVERSIDRLEWVLAKTYRPRRPSETWRRYHRLYSMSHGDERVDRVTALIERARFAGETDDETIEEIIALTDELVAERVVFGGQVLPSPTQ